jgi:hypothetical protein
MVVTKYMSTWADVTNTPVCNQDEYVVAYPGSGAGRLYRLRTRWALWANSVGRMG